jgi:hypothetical protein
MVSDSFMSSVNNDWKNLVILHGNEEVALDDVWGIGKVICVKFNGDKSIMVNVVSRWRGSSKHVSNDLNGKKGRRGEEGGGFGGGWDILKVVLRCGRIVCVMKIVSWNVRWQFVWKYFNKFPKLLI